MINIRDKLVIPQGMMKGFFGDLLEKFMIDENREKDKLILKKLYGYKNIDLIAEKKVKLDILFPVLDKFFGYYVKQEELEAKNVNNVNK